jgi:LPXTG-site transpeptidase (sortase) family protein
VTSSTPTPVPVVAAPVATRAPSTPVRLRIPAIGVDTPLVRLGLTSKGELAVPAKAMDAGWYTGSPVPGQVGPAVIAGHVHWSGIDAVFARLTELAPGDSILVALADRTTATFTVDRVATYAKTKFPTALVYGPLEVAGLRLITCGGYDPASRTYEANVIAFATLATG